MYARHIESSREPGNGEVHGRSRRELVVGCVGAEQMPRELKAGVMIHDDAHQCRHRRRWIASHAAEEPRALQPDERRGGGRIIEPITYRRGRWLDQARSIERGPQMATPRVQES